MTSARPLFFVLLITFSLAATSAFGADEKAQPLVSQQNQTVDPALFGRDVAEKPVSDLFFLNNEPRLEFSAPVEQSRPAAVNQRNCYFMRMYKVKRKERFADGENGLLGYSTCELASNYQVHSAVAHMRTDAPQK
jgi:hypothetical protein